MSTLNITLFGAPRIVRDGAAVTVERRKSLALLAYLAVTRQPHGRDALATLLWPDADGERARAGLRRALVDLNAALGKGWVAAEGDQIALRADAGLRVDVGRFHAALARVAAHSHPPHRLCDACLADLTEAASIYTADFLAGFTLADAADFDEWQGFQTESLRLELGGALEKLATGLAGRQEYAAALPHARRWLALDPLHEPAHRLLMQLHAQAGDRAAALRQYDACGKVLQAELGIAPEPETTALAETIRRGAAGDPAPAFAGALAAPPPHNLPADPTPFIGRAGELAQIAARLADPTCRLLTILGPGGMGKTRLAIQAARGQTDVFSHGVWFVDLMPITSAELLAAAILQALPGTAQAGADAQPYLLRYLRDKHLLLVLDNFEQLVEGGAELLPKLLSVAPKVKLLVTSRVRLNLREEWLAPLAGLEMPGDVEREAQEHEDTKDHEAREARRARSDERESSRFASFVPLRDFAIQTSTLEHYSATALFLACVRRLRPDFQPTTADASHIVRICRLLDGTPLAIELAAAWHRALPLSEIGRELERGLSLLATKARGVPKRQRSMTATFEYSWGLLSPHERRILRQASVFRGGFTREAAAAITDATLSDLDSLVDASWISLNASGRYDMHELARQYCAEKLAVEHVGESGETADQARDRHAAYYRALLLARQGEFYRRQGVVSEMATQYDNLLAAWNWFIATDDLEAVRTMIPGLHWIAYRQGWGRAFKALLEVNTLKFKKISTAPIYDPNRDSERALVLATILTTLLEGFDVVSVAKESWNAWVVEATPLLTQAEANDARWREVNWLLRYRVARGYYDWGNYAESANLVRTLLLELDEGYFRPWPYTDEAGYYWQIEGRLWLAACVAYLGQHEESRHLAEQSLALATQIDAPFLKIEGLDHLALSLIYRGDCEQAEKYARELLAVCRAHGNRVDGAQACWTMGQALAGQGSYVRARVFLRRTLAFARETGDKIKLVVSLHHLGALELMLGNVAEAKRFLQEMNRLCEDWDLAFGLRAALTGLARAALAAGDLFEAKVHLLRALRISSRVFPIPHTIEAIAAMAELRQAEGHWEAAAELCAALLSWPATPNYAPETTQHLRAELAARLERLEAQLSPEVFAAAVARGRSRQIDDVVAQLIGEPTRQATDEAAALI